jgi:heme exporter protein D
MSSPFGIYSVLAECVKVLALALKVVRRLSQRRSTLLKKNRDIDYCTSLAAVSYREAERR